MIRMLINSFKIRQDEDLFDFILFLCLCLLVIGLPTSKALVSITQGLLFANWLAGRNYKEKLNRFLNNKPAIFLSSIYFAYIIGLIWTQDFGYAVTGVSKDKLPFLSMVLVVSSSRQIPTNRLNTLFLLFVFSVLFTSVIGVIGYLTGSIVHSRELSVFVLHVHFGMLIVMAVFLFPWLCKQMQCKCIEYQFSLLVSLWLIVFLFIMSTLTGILSLLGVCLFLLLRFIYRKPVFSRIAAVSLALITIAAIAIYIIMQVTRPLYRVIDPEPATLNELTAEGNRYSHYFDDDMRENGHLVYIFIVNNELREAWNKRSNFDFDSLDAAGNRIRYTIYRYLSSKGLRKDKEGLQSIDQQEVEAIERGVINYLHLNWPPFYVRLHQTIWELKEYQRKRDPEGHSLAKRIEMWKATVVAIKERPVLGWGTGDVLHAVDYGLAAINSKLEDHGLRHPHNQFLHILVMLGISGLIVIFTLLFLFVKTSGAYRVLPYNILLVIIFVSMLGNSPFDSQTPINFFLFFSLAFGISYNNSIIKK
ncbi:MAG: O-antigen ligase family protein [Bacteroidales bacterium]